MQASSTWRIFEISSWSTIHRMWDRFSNFVSGSSMPSFPSTQPRPTRTHDNKQSQNISVHYEFDVHKLMREHGLGGLSFWKEPFLFCWDIHEVCLRCPWLQLNSNSNNRGHSSLILHFMKYDAEHFGTKSYLVHQSQQLRQYAMNEGNRNKEEIRRWLFFQVFL